MNLGSLRTGREQTLINIPRQRMRKLNEALHIFDKNNTDALGEIEQSYKIGVKMLFNPTQAAIKLLCHSDIRFVKCPDMYGILKNSNVTTQLYLGIDPTTRYGDGMNICLAVNDPNMFEIPVDSLYKEDKNGIPDLVTIIATIPAGDMEDLFHNNLNIGLIRHEILHIFHGIVKKDFAIRCGKAYYYSDEIVGALQEEFPTELQLRQYLQYPPDDYMLCCIFAAGIYYLDKSEKEAWLQSFDSFDQYNKFPGVKKDYQDYMPYRTYQNLYNLIERYQDGLSNIFNVIDKNDVQLCKALDIIKKWQMEQPATNLRRIIKKWLFQCREWFAKASAIHKDNYSL